jgi:hypothetical protein
LEEEETEEELWKGNVFLVEGCFVYFGKHSTLARRNYFAPALPSLIQLFHPLFMSHRPTDSAATPLVQYTQFI